jgi:succinoglycan biosynthesis transport protein ExoP
MVDEREIVSEEESGGLGDFLQAIKRRLLAVWLTAMSVLVVGVAIVFLWPTVYTSTATILLEEPEVPEDLIRTTVTKLASEQIQYINQ